MAKNNVTCPVCGVEEPVHASAPGEGALPLHEIGEFRCDACSSRTVYGQLMPRIVIEPARGARDLVWVRLRIQDPKTKEDLYAPVDMDPKLAVMVARNILSLVKI